MSVSRPGSDKQRWTDSGSYLVSGHLGVGSHQKRPALYRNCPLEAHAAIYLSVVQSWDNLHAASGTISRHRVAYHEFQSVKAHRVRQSKLSAYKHSSSLDHDPLMHKMRTESRVRRPLPHGTPIAVLAKRRSRMRDDRRRAAGTMSRTVSAHFAAS